jgi:polysaccharide biosynthesis/export protein VpsN
MKLIFDRIVFTASLLLAIGLVFSGCATSADPEFTSAPSAAQAVAPISPQPTQETAGLRFQVGDTVIVTFSDTPAEIKPHEERVKEDGNITLPLIGPIQAKDRTAGDLQKAIHDAYVPKYYVRLTVTVTHVPVEKVYYVGGEVRAPGSRTWLSGTTLTKAIQNAGGLTDFAKKDNILLTRANGTQVKVDWKKASQNPKFDPRISPNDNILVFRRKW